MGERSADGIGGVDIALTLISYSRSSRYTFSSAFRVVFNAVLFKLLKWSPSLKFKVGFIEAGWPAIGTRFGSTLGASKGSEHLENILGRRELDGSIMDA